MGEGGNKMRTTYYLAIFVLVCCILVYIEAKPMTSLAEGTEMKRSTRMRRQMSDFSLSNIIKIILKAVIDSILQGMPVVG
ncbi:UNVERIFIED_CONTAM: hypothetical protein NCL1_32423 [Trichonephila clavipes]